MSHPEHITILGDGQMALVLADVLCERGMPVHSVRIWGPIADHANLLRETRRSVRLPGFVLDQDVIVTTDAREALSGATLVINAIPTQFMRGVWQQVVAIVDPEVPIVSVSKGIENKTLLLPTQIVQDVLSHAFGGGACPPLCALSGPTIAAELASRMPAAMVAASESRILAERVQDLLNVSWLRIYAHDDIIGVELAGAVKNVIALAAGMLDGLGAGDNAKSALLARGLSEIARLGVANGAKIDTFFGIAGVGDLATTCFSPQGRNRTCGERLGKGESLDSILASSSSVVEGVPTSRSVIQLARRENVDMPIAFAVHGILFEDLSPEEAIRNLMSRETKFEQVG
jgi:glycerol-3-phosphate dehydrogenase (NAD(P)+)